MNTTTYDDEIKTTTTGFAGVNDVSTCSTSESEKILRELWADMLDVDQDEITAFSHFFELGGDSLAATELSTAGENQGLYIPRFLIFESPDFASMASQVVILPSKEMGDLEPKPLSLLKGDSALARRLAADLCGVQEDAIEDIYPATALQAGLMARSITMPGAYVSSWLLNGLGIAGPERLFEVLKQAVKDIPILRTAMVDSAEHDFVQVVLQTCAMDIEVVRVTSLKELDLETRKPAMTLGSRLTKIEVIIADDMDTPAVMWHAHHSTYDMSSLQLIVRHIRSIAAGEQVLPPHPSFALFVAHTLVIREGSEWQEFWSDQLKACPTSFFPFAKEETIGSEGKDRVVPGFRTDSRHVHQLPRFDSKFGFTLANTFYTAWALLLGCYEHSDDVLFGVSNGGRYAPVPRCNEIIGPTIATTPMRIGVGDHTGTVADLIKQISMKAVRASAFEQAGLPGIRRLGSDGQTACNFRTLVNVQTLDVISNNPLLTMAESVARTEPLDYALVLEVFPPIDSCAKTFPLHISYDSRLLRHDQILQVAAQLESMLSLLITSPEKTLHELGIGPNLHAPVPKRSTNGTLEPFGLLSTIPNQSRRYAAVACGVNEFAVDDVYPCTPMQTTLMLATLKQPAAHVSQFVFCVRDGIAADQVMKAFGALYHWAPVLRTRLFQAPMMSAEGKEDQLLQVVVDESIFWSEAVNLDGYLTADRKMVFGLGLGLTRFGLIRDKPHGPVRSVVLTAHGAVCDNSSVPVMVQILNAVSSDMVGDVEAVPHNMFVLRTLQSSSSNAAKDFWARTLKDCSSPAFPEIPEAHQPVSTASLTRQTSVSAQATATLLQAAWALTLAQYYDSSDIVFGLGLDACSSHSILGPTLSIVPQRIIIPDKDCTVAQFLRAVRARSFAVAEYAQCSPGFISNIDESCAAACRVQNLLIVHDAAVLHDNAGVFQLMGRAGESDNMTPRDLALVADVTLHSDGGVTLHVTFDPGILQQVEVQRFAAHYEHVLQQIDGFRSAGIAGSRLSDISHISAEHMSELRSWNEHIPKPIERGVHELFEEQAALRPDDPAICARDGQWTFAQLDTDAERLARWLCFLGVGHGTYVPLIFEKCGLAIIAMLAVLKAGAASVTLDPSQPTARLRGLIQLMEGPSGTGCPVTICSADSRDLAVSLGHRVAVLDDNTLRQLGNRSIKPSLSKENRVSPATTAFVLFTSGSTGTPKGILIPHQAFASSIRGHSEVLRFSTGPGSRNFQFTAYTSDVSIGEIFTSLAVGSCVCVPSDWDRQNNVAGAIRELGANWAFFTPSVAALLQPDDVPGLRTMVFGGETASPENLQTWAPALHLINSFGPAETSIWSHCMRRKAEPHDNGNHIGRGISCATWIVDPNNHTRLRPIGAVGEMVVEGPNLADGYLGEPDKTAATFVRDPPWMPDSRKPTRVYRSGDLARFLPDGTVQFLGRRDHQVKLRGLRVELGEIEHQIRKHLPDDILVAVDVVSAHQSGPRKLLTAFLASKVPESGTGAECVNDDASTTEGGSESDPEKRKALLLLASSGKAFDHLMDTLRGLEAAIRAVLPGHMVPSAFVPLREMPLTGSAKTDRKALKLLASMIPVEELGRMGRETAVHQQPPSSAMERILARLWSAALMSTLDLDTRDSFFRVGGESLSAMRLISLARREGVNLSVAQVFKYPTLREMASAATVLKENGDEGASSHNDNSPSAPAVSKKYTSCCISAARCQTGRYRGHICLYSPPRGSRGAIPR